MSEGSEPLPAANPNRRRIKKKGTVVFPQSLFHELPETWRYLTVDECLELGLITDFVDGNHGGLYPRKADFGNNGYMFVTAKQIQNGEVDFGSAPRLPESKAKKLRKGWARGGDILLTHNATVGRTARVPLEIGTFLLGTSATYYRVNHDQLDRDFLFFAFCAPQWQGQLESIMAQTTRNQVSIQKQAFFRLPVPPLNEQRRIVAKIEALQERSRKAREALAEVGPLLEQFRQSLLAAAFRGDLTADWRAENPDVEPASELLARIRTERRQKWEQAELANYNAKGKKPPKNWQDYYQEPEPVDESELPELPVGWCWASFEEVASIDSKLVSPTDFPSHPHIAPDNIEKETGRLLEFRTIAEDGVKSNKNHFFAGQIVYSKIRPYLSKVIVAEFEGLCSADMYPISTLLNTNYLFRYMLSDDFLAAVQEEAGNRVVLPKVNQKQLYAVLVPVAPLEEQPQISARISNANEIISSLDDARTAMVIDLDQLDQSILAKAFRGELVPQDPQDEPAAVLLERIRQQREAATQNGQPKRKSKRISRNKNA